MACHGMSWENIDMREWLSLNIMGFVLYNFKRLLWWFQTCMFSSVLHADAIRCRCCNKSFQKLRWLADIFGERYSRRLLTMCWQASWSVNVESRCAWLSGSFCSLVFQLDFSARLWIWPWNRIEELFDGCALPLLFFQRHVRHNMLLRLPWPNSKSKRWNDSESSFQRLAQLVPFHLVQEKSEGVFYIHHNILNRYNLLMFFPEAGHISPTFRPMWWHLVCSDLASGSAAQRQSFWIAGCGCVGRVNSNVLVICNSLNPRSERLEVGRDKFGCDVEILNIGFYFLRSKGDTGSHPRKFWTVSMFTVYTS